MGQNKKQVAFKLAPEIIEALKSQAAWENRSLNNTVEILLRWGIAEMCKRPGGNTLNLIELTSGPAPDLKTLLRERTASAAVVYSQKNRGHKKKREKNQGGE